MTIYRERIRPMPTPVDLVRLEEMVNRYGLSHVVEALGVIAADKGSTTFTDRTLSRSWDKVGVLLDQFSDGAACRRVST